MARLRSFTISPTYEIFVPKINVKADIENANFSHNLYEWFRILLFHILLALQSGLSNIMTYLMYYYDLKHLVSQRIVFQTHNLN